MSRGDEAEDAPEDGAEAAEVQRAWGPRTRAASAGRIDAMRARSDEEDEALEEPEAHLGQLLPGKRRSSTSISDVGDRDQDRDDGFHEEEA